MVAYSIIIFVIIVVIMRPIFLSIYFVRIIVAVIIVILFVLVTMKYFGVKIYWVEFGIGKCACPYLDKGFRHFMNFGDQLWGIKSFEGVQHILQVHQPQLYLFDCAPLQIKVFLFRGVLIADASVKTIDFNIISNLDQLCNLCHEVLMIKAFESTSIVINGLGFLWF